MSNLINDGNIYWNKKGQFQAFISELNSRMPLTGNTSGELPVFDAFIDMSNWYYDYYNNGFCNRENRWAINREAISAFAADKPASPWHRFESEMAVVISEDETECDYCLDGCSGYCDEEIEVCAGCGIEYCEDEDCEGETDYEGGCECECECGGDFYADADHWAYKLENIMNWLIPFVVAESAEKALSAA